MEGKGGEGAGGEAGGEEERNRNVEEAAGRRRSKALLKIVTVLIICFKCYITSPSILPHILSILS